MKLTEINASVSEETKRSIIYFLVSHTRVNLSDELSKLAKNNNIDIKNADISVLGCEKIVEKIIEQYPESFTDRFVMYFFGGNIKDKIYLCLNNDELFDKLIDLVANYIKNTSLREKEGLYLLNDIFLYIAEYKQVYKTSIERRLRRAIERKGNEFVKMLANILEHNKQLFESLYKHSKNSTAYDKIYNETDYLIQLIKGLDTAGVEIDEKIFTLTIKKLLAITGIWIARGDTSTKNTLNFAIKNIINTDNVEDLNKILNQIEQEIDRKSEMMKEYFYRYFPHLQHPKNKEKIEKIYQNLKTYIRQGFFEILYRKLNELRKLSVEIDIKFLGKIKNYAMT